MGSTLSLPPCKRCNMGSMFATYKFEASCYACGHVEYSGKYRRRKASELQQVGRFFVAGDGRRRV